MKTYLILRADNTQASKQINTFYLHITVVTHLADEGFLVNGGTYDIDGVSKNIGIKYTHRTNNNNNNDDDNNNNNNNNNKYLFKK